MVDRRRHEELKQLYRFRERMHEGDWPQDRLKEYGVALFSAKGLRFDGGRE